MKIQDGKGTGRQAFVDSKNRLEVHSTVQTEAASVSLDDGLTFIFSHGDYVSMTTLNTETGILHIKNTSTAKVLKIHSIRTCGDVINKWKLYKNSTGGTLITDATAGSSQNLNLVSQNSADAIVYKGADAKTVSGGTMLSHLINGIGHSDEVFDGTLILGTNDSIQLTVEVASTSEICCRVIGYFE